MKRRNSLKTVVECMKEQNDWDSMNVSSVNLPRMLKLFVLISRPAYAKFFRRIYLFQ